MSENQQRKQWTIAEAPAVMKRHIREGTCPECLTEVVTFISQFLLDQDGISFGCPHCSALAAYAITGARKFQEHLDRRN